MHSPNRRYRLVIAMLAAFSLVAGSAPVSAQVSTAVHITSSKKVLSKEVKAAKAAVNKAQKILTIKQKSLSNAKKVLAAAQKKLDVAKAKAGISPTSKSLLTTKSPTKSIKAVMSAQRAFDRATALVSSLVRARDKAQANLSTLQAKYAWLVEDFSTLDCGKDTQVTNANGAVETVWNCGVVYQINDGDTVWVKTTDNEIVEVRNIGLQTPELAKSGKPAQCGAKQAKDLMTKLLPAETTVVQLRSITNGINHWGGMGRAERSIYALNPGTGLYDIDVQAEIMKQGWSLYWPSLTEWTHGKEYLQYLLDARSAGIGLWNPNLCGAAIGTTPDMWLNASAPTIGVNSEPAFGEYIVLHNPTNSPMDLSGWSLRDGSLDFFSVSTKYKWDYTKNAFPHGTVISPGQVLTVYISDPGHYLATYAHERETSLFDGSWSKSGWAQIANGMVAGEKVHGDGIYLMDSKGNTRNSMLSVCSTTVWQCDKPTWLNTLTATYNASHIVPFPMTLSLVQNNTRDRYNPVLSLGTTMATTASALVSKGFTVTTGATVDSASVAGAPVAIRVSGSNTNMVGSRVPVAALPANTTATALTIHAASGYNAVPNIAGMSQADARNAIRAAGFQVGTVTIATGQTVLGAVQPTDTRLALNSTINFTVNAA